MASGSAAGHALGRVASLGMPADLQVGPIVGRGDELGQDFGVVIGKVEAGQLLRGEEAEGGAFAGARRPPPKTEDAEKRWGNPPPARLLLHLSQGRGLRRLAWQAGAAGDAPV